MKHSHNYFMAGALVALMTIGSAAISHAAMAATDATTPSGYAGEQIGVQAQPYQIAVNDVISVNVVGFADLSSPAGGLTVLPDGTIDLPLIGRIHAAGKTTEQLQDELAQRWKKYVNDPSVTVSISAKHVQNVLISGYVTRPGATSYRPAMRILDALAEVGGSLATGDLSKTVVTHTDGEVETLDLSNPGDKGTSPANIFIQVGDNIYIPQRTYEISVVGAVTKPGSYEFKDSMTVMDAITDAGGAIDASDLTSATLSHNGVDQKLDLDSMLRGGDMTNNIKLSPGDRIVIPPGNRVYVMGNVNRPGFYYYKPGDRILDALNGVGGPTSGDLSKINYIQDDPATGKPVLTKYDVETYLRTGVGDTNVPLKPNVVLYVPHKKDPVSLDSVLNGSTIARALLLR